MTIKGVLGVVAILGLLMLGCWAQQQTCSLLYGQAKTATDSLIVASGNKCFAFRPTTP